ADAEEQLRALRRDPDTDSFTMSTNGLAIEAARETIRRMGSELHLARTSNGARRMSFELSMPAARRRRTRRVRQGDEAALALRRGLAAPRARPALHGCGSEIGGEHPPPRPTSAAGMARGYAAASNRLSWLAWRVPAAITQASAARSMIEPSTRWTSWAVKPETSKLRGGSKCSLTAAPGSSVGAA